MLKRGSKEQVDYYLTCFHFDEFSDRDSEGTFQIVVQARSPEDAVDRSYELIEKLHEDTTLFQRPCSIYIEGIIRLRGSFEKGLLVNYSSTWTGDHPRASIGCLIPEQKHESMDYGWKPTPKKGTKKQKEGDLETIEPFIDFGGQAVAEDRAARSRATSPSVALSSSTASPKEKVAERTKEEARAAAAAKKETERAAAARRRALAGTMRELQPKR